jgi:hypothetical protein
VLRPDFIISREIAPGVMYGFRALCTKTTRLLAFLRQATPQISRGISLLRRVRSSVSRSTSLACPFQQEGYMIRLQT